MKVLDLFSGAGGFSVGFSKAGYEIVGAVDIDEWATDTFRHNHPGVTVVKGDMELMSDEELLATFTDKPDVILGGPPCQGFSICNKNAGDPNDPRNTLFMQMVRAARLFDPKCVIIENVPNLTKAKTKSGDLVTDIIVKEFEEIGYTAKWTILSATDYGVPQIRRRFVCVATKNPIDNPFPKPTHSVDGSDGLEKTPTLWEAISDLPVIEAREGSEEMPYTIDAENYYQRMLRGDCDKVYNHKAMMHGANMVKRFETMKWGQSMADVPDELKKTGRNGKSTKGYDQNNRRMFPDSPCHTIPASFYANFVHPYRNRNFTAREGARIQSFPDDYVFLGKPTVVSRKLLEREGRSDEKHLCQYNQIGNAVPPLLAQAIAENLKGQL